MIAGPICLNSNVVDHALDKTSRFVQRWMMIPTDVFVSSVSHVLDNGAFAGKTGLANESCEQFLLFGLANRPFERNELKVSLINTITIEFEVAADELSRVTSRNTHDYQGGESLDKLLGQSTGVFPIKKLACDVVPFIAVPRVEKLATPQVTNNPFPIEIVEGLRPSDEPLWEVAPIQRITSEIA